MYLNFIILLLLLLLVVVVVFFLLEWDPEYVIGVDMTLVSNSL